MSDLPRVTHILAAVGLGPDFTGVPTATLEAAAKRGALVHEAIEAIAYGYHEADPPEIAGYLDAYRRFVKESGHEAIASEIAVVHPAWGYVGHPDRVGWLAGHRAILDWKSGEAPDLRAAGRQLAGYRLAWNAARPTEPVSHLAVVQFRDDGTYRVHDDDRVNDPRHEQVFLAAVVIYQERTA